jgi:hypothetical protein
MEKHVTILISGNSHEAGMCNVHLAVMLPFAWVLDVRGCVYHPACLSLDPVAGPLSQGCTPWRDHRGDSTHQGGRRGLNLERGHGSSLSWS